MEVIIGSPVATIPLTHNLPSPDLEHAATPIAPIVGTSLRSRSLTKSGAKKRANAIVEKYFKDLDVPSQSLVLDSLLQHATMKLCSQVSKIYSPHSRKASDNIVRNLRGSYSSLKRKASNDGVSARRSIVAAIAGPTISPGIFISFEYIFMVFNHFVL